MRASSATPRAPRPDQRIAERRSDVARAARRRRLAGVGSVAVVLAILASGFAVLHSPIFSARHVVVTGASHEGTGQILAAAGLSGHPPLIDLNAVRAMNGIDALPWVASARVSRRWPESVDVSVTERIAVGVVKRPSGGVAVLDATGHVLETVPVAPKGLVVLDDVGPVPPAGQSVETRGSEVATLAAAIPSALHRFVSTVGSSPADGLTLTLHAGPEVLMGAASDFGEKFTALATLLVSEHATLFSAHLVDLRVPSSPVLTP